MEKQIEQKLRELDQLRYNLLQNMRCGDEQARAYQQMCLEVVEGCQGVLRGMLKILKGEE